MHLAIIYLNKIIGQGVDGGVYKGKEFSYMVEVKWLDY